MQSEKDLILCIGGTLDGKRIKYQGEYAQAVPEEKLKPYDSNESNEIMKKYKYQQYQIKKLFDSKTKYRLYVLEGLNLIEELINGYNPK